MDKVCFTQYIPSNKCEIKGYTQVSQSQPAQNPIQPAKSQTNSDKPSSKNNNKTLNWTIGLGAAATLIALGVIAGRKGHLGERVQELLGGVKKSAQEGVPEPKPPKTPDIKETAEPPVEPPTGTHAGEHQKPIESPAEEMPEQPVREPEGTPAETNELPNEAPVGESPETQGDNLAGTHTEEPHKPPVNREVNQEGGQPNHITEEPASSQEQPINQSQAQETTPSAQNEPHERPQDTTPPAPKKTQELPQDKTPPTQHKPQEQPKSGQNKPARNNPPAQDISETPPKKPTTLQRVKNFIKDPFGFKARKAAKEEAERVKRAQEAAEKRERERLKVLAEEEAMKERLKQYPNMKMSELVNSYAGKPQENWPERSAIYKLIQQKRYAVHAAQGKMYSKMSKQELLKEFEKLQAVNAGDRDYDAVMMVKTCLEQKGYVFKDKLFEGHKPLHIVPYGQTGVIDTSFRNKRLSECTGLAQTPDIITPDLVKVIDYGLSGCVTGFNTYTTSPKFGRMYCLHPTGFTFHWEDKPMGSWTSEHCKIFGNPGFKLDGSYYATVLSYTNRKPSGLARPENSFSFVIPGDLSKETLDKIRNYFIKSGIIDEFEYPYPHYPSYEERLKMLDKMIEAVCDIVNK